MTNEEKIKQDRRVVDLVSWENKIRADAEMIGVTEDEEYIQYKGHLYKKVAEQLKEQRNE